MQQKERRNQNRLHRKVPFWGEKKNFFYENSDPNYCCFYIVVFAEKPTKVQFTTDIALSESTAEGGYDFNKYF